MGEGQILSVEGQIWPGTARCVRVPPVGKDQAWLKELSLQVAGYRGVDGRLDGVWTCQRSGQIFVFNSRKTAVEANLAGNCVSLAPSSIRVGQWVGKNSN